MEKSIKQDIKVLRKTLFTDEELHRKEAKKKRAAQKHYLVSKVWDPEKGKYVKVKRFKKRSTFTKKEMKERFGSVKSAIKPIKQKSEKKKHAKVNAMPLTKKVEKAVTVTMYGTKLVWDSDILRYKQAA